METELEPLLEPIPGDDPCGEDLEDSQLLASFDAYRIFGRIEPVAGDEIDWREVRDRALEGLRSSKDLRLLACLALARLHTRGVGPFCDALEVAASWFDRYPDSLYPRVDEDAILRKNALNGFADRMAAVDAVRRSAFVSNPQFGAFSLRDHDIAKGNVPAPEGADAPTEAQINAALTAASSEDLRSLDERVMAGGAALRRVDASMRERGGTAAAPDFDALLAALDSIHRLLQEQLTSRAGGGEVAAEGAETEGSGGAAMISVGSIRSRDDALRALDAVAAFFRKNEPSSPVPLFIERAKRLVAKDFLEVLADVAPDGVAQAKLAGGLRDE